MVWKTITTFLISMLPLVELKGGIPYAAAQGLIGLDSFGSVLRSPGFWVCVVGSSAMCPLILWVFEPMMRWMRTARFLGLGRFARFVDRRIEKGTRRVSGSRLLLWGLFLFVAVPLPSTGLWTGSAIAAFLRLEPKKAIPAVVLGNLVAGLLLLYITFFAGNGLLSFLVLRR